MLLPLRDALTLRHKPVVALLLVVTNVLVYLAGMLPADTQVDGSTRTIRNADVWLVEYGAVPCELLGRCGNQRAVVQVDGGPTDPAIRSVSAQVDPHPPVLTLLTSMFLHVGILHLLLNLVFLWVLGSTIEDAMRPLGFAAFYVLAGMVAGMAQALAAPGTTEATVGASGAIAGVLGAYLVLYPRVRVLTLLIPPFTAWIAAWMVIGGWLLVQVVGVWQDLLAPERLASGVAYVAHVAGLVVGLGGAHLLAIDRDPAADDGAVRRA